MANAKEEMVTVTIPKTREKKDDFFCAINGKSYQIKRGVPVQVPKEVDEVIRHQQKMDEIAIENAEKAPKDFA